MKFVNRGYLLITPTKTFIDWANTQSPELPLDAEFVEGNVYLIEEDFLETEPILEANFKKIFKNELEAVTEDEEQWPEKLTMELFLSFFTWEMGTTVFDLQKTDLNRD
ncbi:MAG: hypothetical protein WC044_02910 [Crocinitomicaceae bacterium]